MDENFKSLMLIIQFLQRPQFFQKFRSQVEPLPQMPVTQQPAKFQPRATADKPRLMADKPRAMADKPSAMGDKPRAMAVRAVPAILGRKRTLQYAHFLPNPVFFQTPGGRSECSSCSSDMSVELNEKFHHAASANYIIHQRSGSNSLPSESQPSSSNGSQSMSGKSSLAAESPPIAVEAKNAKVPKFIQPLSSDSSDIGNIETKMKISSPRQDLPGFLLGVNGQLPMIDLVDLDHVIPDPPKVRMIDMGTDPIFEIQALRKPKKLKLVVSTFKIIDLAPKKFANSGCDPIAKFFSPPKPKMIETGCDGLEAEMIPKLDKKLETDWIGTRSRGIQMGPKMVAKSAETEILKTANVHTNTDLKHCQNSDAQTDSVQTRSQGNQFAFKSQIHKKVNTEFPVMTEIGTDACLVKFGDDAESQTDKVQQKAQSIQATIECKDTGAETNSPQEEPKEKENFPDLPPCRKTRNGSKSKPKIIKDAEMNDDDVEIGCQSEAELEPAPVRQGQKRKAEQESNFIEVCEA